MTYRVQCASDLVYCPEFVPKHEADRWFQLLLHELQWGTEEYKIYGKSVTAPRRVAWYGDSGAYYTYSGIEHKPLAWTECLAEIRTHIENATDREFNSVLANLYRDGQDSMGWHADREKELGPQPVIASLSLGATRLFKLKHNRTGEVIDLELEHGSLLIMAGEMQSHWKHSVPKSRKVSQPRINLTFRKIVM